MTFEDFLEFWNMRCAYCGDVIPTVGIDRIDNMVGYTLANCISCCFVCNKMKSAYSFPNFLEQCRKIVAFNVLSESFPMKESWAEAQRKNLEKFIGTKTGYLPSQEQQELNRRYYRERKERQQAKKRQGMKLSLRPLVEMKSNQVQI